MTVPSTGGGGGDSTRSSGSRTEKTICCPHAGTICADVLVAGKNRYELYRIGMEEPFFFHPNSAAFRLKRLVKG